MQQGYELLSNGDEPTNANLEVPPNPLSLSSILLGLFALLCTIANAGLWWSSASNVAPLKQHDSLARPSTYMGLEKLKYDPAEEAQRVFANFPFLLTQISEAEPKRVWPDDPTQRLTSIGTVSPDTRRFMLTPKISSVAQFRAIDFGYENCSLHFALQVSSTEELPSQGVAVDVWMLDASTRLDAAHISWSSRPPRKELFETLTFFPNTSTTSDRTWKCAWGEFQTFEFACAQNGEQDGCNVDFWQSPKISTLGVTLTQRSSLA